ncbi:haloacid dehalogenase-like hydrolase [Streptomyces sp. NPDC005438]|uniref:haloacid dehalogenase-like hydrolase n=1 Tax=Streptomyces sp. NPDC005438 TaxID=3156880 RepID=UPI0033B37C22
MRSRSLLAALSLAAVAVVTAAHPSVGQSTEQSPAGGKSDQRHCPQLSKKLKWYGDNRDKLQKVIDERGLCGKNAGNRTHPRPVAAFDWDNTVTKNDITDSTIAWALEHDKILRPKSWKSTSKWMTRAAHRALTEACGTDVPVGKPLPTSKNVECTDEILEIRHDAQTMDGEPAFEGKWDYRRTKPNYAWVPQLFAGHTPAEVTAYAAKARKEVLAAPVGEEKTVGTHTIHGYVRYYKQVKDLIATLQKAGFEVYVVSAGSEPVTEAWTPGVGVDADHTIAIRSVLKNGRITTRTEGCGDMPDSKGEAIPYIDGKRCWINKDVYGIKGADAWERQDWKHTIALGGGDADTDVTFVNDATGAHLVLNRNQNEIMCRGYDNADGRWVVNPMFIEPLERKETFYPCSSAAYINPNGALSPVQRPDGSVVPDQADRIHG